MVSSVLQYYVMCSTDLQLAGGVGTVFAYGQTGSGKTFTMTGEREDPDKRGVIPNSFEHIFSHIASTQDEQYLVRVSYLEIYKVRMAVPRHPLLVASCADGGRRK